MRNGADMTVKMLKVKHEAIQILPMRTRTVATLMIDTVSLEKYGMLLAKGSISPPAGTGDRNQYMVDLFLNRAPGQKTMTRPFVSLREQMIHERDVVRLERWTTMNLEHDMKRRPVRPRMAAYPGGTHLAFDTEAWPTLQDAEMARDIFDEWRKTRSLKTLQDFCDWEDFYIAQRGNRLSRKGGKKAVMQVTETGSVGILVRVFLRAYVREAWGLRRTMTYPTVARVLTGLGFKTSKDDVKNGNKGDLIEEMVPRTPMTEDFWRKLIVVFDSMDEKRFFMRN